MWQTCTNAVYRIELATLTTKLALIIFFSYEIYFIGNQNVAAAGYRAGRGGLIRIAIRTVRCRLRYFIGSYCSISAKCYSRERVTVGLVTLQPNLFISFGVAADRLRILAIKRSATSALFGLEARSGTKLDAASLIGKCPDEAKAVIRLKRLVGYVCDVRSERNFIIQVITQRPVELSI